MKIEVNNLSKKYKGKEILKDFSYCEDIDTVLFIKGQSGVGKTTFLKILSGIDKQYGGTVNLSANRISFMFQEDRLIPYISVLKNVSAVSDEAKALHYLSLLKLQNEANSSPNTLSGGMKRRVSLARALAYDSDLVILDEPFKGLDDQLRTDIYDIIKDELGKRCFIIVSHDERDYLALGGKILDLTQ